MEATLHSVMTCPECGATAEEEMPTDACIFFAVAFALYVGGFGGGAAGAVFAGVIVETIAWISVAFHPKERAGEVSTAIRQWERAK